MNFSYRVLTSVLLFAISVCQKLHVQALPLYKRSQGNDVQCASASWDDVCIFFLLNYVTHAVTIKSSPGALVNTNIRWIMATLFAPFSGVIRGGVGIAKSGACASSNELQRSAQSGALCALRRSSSWRPKPGDILSGCVVSSSMKAGSAIISIQRTEVEDISQNEVKIHGHLPERLPEGIVLSKLPKNTRVLSTGLHDSGKCQLARSTVILKSLCGITQLLYATLTLFRTLGQQIRSYGYAAYGLTVIPYAVSTLINLVASCVNPDFPAMFLVDNDVLRSCRRSGLCFDGIIGTMNGHSSHCQTILIRSVEVVVGSNGPVIAVSFEVLDNQEISGNLSILPFGNHSSDSSESVNTLVEDLSELDEAKAKPKCFVAAEESESALISSIDGCPPTVDISQALKTELRIPDFGPLEELPANPWPKRLAVSLVILSIIIPYGLIQLLTLFRSGDAATSTEQGWIMSWLVLGQVLGILVGILLQRNDSGHAIGALKLTFVLVLAAVPAIGGFAVVGQMMVSAGDCELGPGSDLF